MSYFSADERMERGEGLPPAPYNLRLTEMDERSAEVGLVWQRPLGRVDGYLVLVRTAGEVSSSRFQVSSSVNSTRNQELETRNLAEWRTALRVVGREKNGARWRVPDEIWVLAGVELAVCAFAGEVASPLSNLVALPPRLRTVTRLGGWPAVEEAAQGQSRAQSRLFEVVEGEQSRAQPPPTEEAVVMMSEGEAESPEPSPQLAGWAEIEAALRRNSAALGRHGLFVRRNS